MRTLAAVFAVLVAASCQSQEAEPPTDGMAAQSQDTEPPTEGLAVIPFIALPGSADASDLADGIQVDLIAAIGKAGQLPVAARSSVDKYRDAYLSIPMMAAELDVLCVLEGSVQRVGSHVRVNVELIEAWSGRRLAAEVYDREILADTQADLVGTIASDMPLSQCATPATDL